MARWHIRPILLLALIACCDVLLHVLEPPYPVIAVFDWPAHLATAVLVVSCVRSHDRAFVAAALTISVAIDLDHLPHDLGWDVLTRSTTRPVTHSFVGVAIFALVALLASRRPAVGAGVAVGALAHLLRDIATGEGVPLLWPASSHELLMPYGVYFAVVATLAAIGHMSQRQIGRGCFPRYFQRSERSREGRGGTPHHHNAPDGPGDLVRRMRRPGRDRAHHPADR
jgi:inner membrane protein